MPSRPATRLDQLVSHIILVDVADILDGFGTNDLRHRQFDIVERDVCVASIALGPWRETDRLGYLPALA